MSENIFLIERIGWMLPKGHILTTSVSDDGKVTVGTWDKINHRVGFDMSANYESKSESYFAALMMMYDCLIERRDKGVSNDDR